MTTKSTPAPVAAPPVEVSTEDQPPWEEPTAVVQASNPEASWIAWWNFAIPVSQYDFETEEEYIEYVPQSVTVRGFDVLGMFENVEEFAKEALLRGWKPIADKQWSAIDVAKQFAAPQPQASSPLPPAAGAPQAKQPWKPGGPAAPQQQAPAQQQNLDNTFIADTLLVANKAKLDGTPYTELRMKGGRYTKFGVRVWKDKLDAVLPGWAEAPPGEHSFMDENGVPFKVKCTFSWDERPGKDGQPKNVYALEIV